MTDSVRILEAIEVLTQQVENLRKEVSGLRTDMRAYDVDVQAHKKKAMPSRMTYIQPLSRWPS